MTTTARTLAASAARTFTDGAPARYASAARAYTDARERGESVSLAHARALTERVAADVLTFRDTFDVAHLGIREAWHVWQVDGRALARATSDPRLATSGRMEAGRFVPVAHMVTVPDLATVYVVARHDPDTNPEDADCYGVEDVDAWKRDEWHYMVMSAHVQLADGRQGVAYLGGVELGEYWPGSDESQVWHTVPELVREAVADAESVPAHTTAHTTGRRGFAYVVHVDAPSQDEADQVMAERLNHDEDYGFGYTLGFERA